jgi:hypothetical protein
VTRGNRPLAIRMPDATRLKVEARAAEAGLTPSEWGRRVIETALANEPTSTASSSGGVTGPEPAAAVQASPPTRGKRSKEHLKLAPQPCKHNVSHGFWCRRCRKRI